MEADRERYSRLAPVDAGLRCVLAVMAVHFFSPSSHAEMCDKLGKAAWNGHYAILGPRLPQTTSRRSDSSPIRGVLHAQDQGSSG